MTVHYISGFQPVGDAATELRAVYPGLDQMMAVSILCTVEDGYGPHVTDDGYTVLYNTRTCGWEVTTP